MLLFAAFASLASAQERHGLLHTADSLLSHRYWSSDIDTNYIVRPSTRWTVTGRINFSGAQVQDEGVADGIHFRSQLDADYKTTVSVGLSYLGLSLNLSLNPAKLSGKYQDYEMNVMAYGKRMGFDFAYQYARNFKGWHENDNEARIALPDDILSLRTLNFNTYYVFNNRRFSYPAAFAHSYLQRRSAGSFMLAVSGNALYAETQNDNLDEHQQPIDFKIINLGIGGGYGYNFVPGKGWLLHISALPTMIVYSHARLTTGDTRIPLHYRFPEFIITSRGSVVKQIGRNMFAGVQMVYHFTSMGHKESLDIYHEKWIARAYFGYRL